MLLYFIQNTYNQSSRRTFKFTGPELKFWTYLVRFCWPGPRAITRAAWVATQREDCNIGKKLNATTANLRILLFSTKTESFRTTQCNINNKQISILILVTTLFFAVNETLSWSFTIFKFLCASSILYFYQNKFVDCLNKTSILLGICLRFKWEFMVYVLDSIIISNNCNKDMFYTSRK